MIPKPIAQITAVDIGELVKTNRRESKTIEFKQQLPTDDRESIGKFLASVASFANATGGDLIFGVVEQRDADGKPTGLIGEARGVGRVNTDQQKLRLEHLVTASIQPRISAIQIQSIDGFPDGPVTVMRVPQSWIGPHMVIYQNQTRFYTRGNAGRIQMDFDQIRAAFLASEGVANRVMSFRDERLARILAGITPVQLPEAPFLALHAIPWASLQNRHRLSPAQLKQQWASFVPTSFGGGSTRFNVDGYLCVSAGWQDTSGYGLIFFNGIFESVDQVTIQKTDQGIGISADGFVEAFIEGCTRIAEGYREFSIDPPISILVAFGRAKGARLYADPMFGYGRSSPVDRDVLLLPEALLERWDANIHQTIRDTVMGLYHACGYEGCKYYDENGNWIERRR